MGTPASATTVAVLIAMLVFTGLSWKLTPSPAPHAQPVRALSGVTPVSHVAAQGLLFPLPLEQRGGLRDSFREKRGLRAHEAVDIMAPRGTPIYAVSDGHIARLFHSVPGGKTIYHFDPTSEYAYYYAHLDRYAEGLAEGQRVRRGDVIGYVGSTGNAKADAPHLHFAIFKLGPQRQWWKGEPLDPYPLLTAAAKP